MSDKEAELRELVVRLTAAIQPAGIVLASIAQSRSQYADEAWAAFSQLADALTLVPAVVDRDLSGPMQ